MENNKMGNFICELRKLNNMTQKDLGNKLGVTDKAVSKWERGLGYPDISLLAAISNILVVTTNELLNGKKVGLEKCKVRKKKIKSLIL
ncbi:MAG TPA: helix-turn-helix transcriptional regulator [Clostridium sp.]